MAIKKNIKKWIFDNQSKLGISNWLRWCQKSEPKVRRMLEQILRSISLLSLLLVAVLPLFCLMLLMETSGHFDEQHDENY